MGNSGLKQHLETAQKTGAFQLSNQSITEIPSALFTVAGNLRTLDLSGNKIAEIPANVGAFAILKHLSLNKNRISSLPAEIGKLAKLETLNLSCNRLTSIPASISNLKNLKQVNLSENQLTTFPLEFCHMKHLDALNLSHNKITEVPAGVKDLQAVELNLNQNQITVISEDLANCPRLKTLRLEENCLQLSALPAKIFQESSVSVLALEGNLFDMKEVAEVEGYASYMERYTATKKKMY